MEHAVSPAVPARLAALAGLVLSGCGVTAGIAPPEPRMSLSASRAVADFARICGDTLPDFTALPGRATAQGYEKDQGEGAWTSATGTASLYAGRGDDGEPLCALDFTTADSPDQADQAFADLGNLRLTGPTTRIGRFRGTLMRLRGPLAPRIRGADLPVRYVIELKPEG